MAVSYGTYTITEVQEGSQIWTTTVAPALPDYTFTISNLTGDSNASIKVGDIIMYTYYKYTVLSISDNGTTVLTGNRVSMKGDTAQWYYGNDLVHTSGTAILPISQTEDVIIGAMYLNTKTGICYKCIAISDSNATWVYAGNIMDGIEIGGRNLIIGTLHPDARGGGIYRPHIFGQISNTAGRGTCTVAEHGIRFTNTTANWQYIYFGNSGTTATPCMLGLEAGETYTLSTDLSWNILSSDTGKADTTTYYMGAALAYSNTESGAFTGLPHNKQFAITQADKGTDMSGRLIYTFTVPETAKKLYLGIVSDNKTASHYATGDYIEARNLKLEKGNKATNWTPAPEDLEQEVTNLRTDLQSQIDEKIQTYYQTTAPSWSDATDRAKHDGDLWYCTESDPYTGYEAKNVYRYDSTNNTWIEYSATSELFDAIDGKSTIFYGTTSDTFEDVEDGDYLVDASNGSTYRYYNNTWITVTDYQTVIDSIEIGGRNLWINTLNPDVSSPDNYPRMVGQTDYTRVASTANNDVAIAEHGIKNIVKKAGKRPRFDFGLLTSTNGFEAGQTYTVSFDWSAKLFSSDTETTTRYLGFYIYDNHTGSNKINEACTDRFFTITTELKGVEQAGRTEFTFTADESATVIRISIMGNADTGQAVGDYFELRNMKLEKGDKATDWSPALEDTQADIEDARKVATNYLSMDLTGIMVADMNDGEQTPSTATGNNVFINNTSVNIRNGQNTLASFGSSGIQIGTTSTFVNIDRDSFDLKRNSNEYIHLGYGEGNAQSGTAVAPYYSIGTRKANSAVGNYSVAEGSNNEASGYASNAQGYNNTASGLMSHAEGYNNTASGAYSSAEGSGNTVSGTTSHVGGLNSTVSGNGSFTHGYGLLGSGDNQAVFGRYNIEDTNYEYAMIIGNGTVDENYTPVRSNLLTVGWDGNIKTASGFDTSMPPFKWKSASYTASNLASGYTDVTTDVSFPNLTGYSRTIMVVGTNSAYTGTTGAYVDSNDYVHIRCRNFNTAASSPTISFVLIYLNNTCTWT